MPLTFAGVAIPGICGAPGIAAPASRAIRTEFPGVHGVSEIRLGRGGRGIEYPVWIFGSQFNSAADVVKFLERLEDLVNTHGKLTETGTIARTFDNCTFDGFESGGAPILPVLGSGMTGTHWTRGVCRWFQMET